MQDEPSHKQTKHGSQELLCDPNKHHVPPLVSRITELRQQPCHERRMAWQRFISELDSSRMNALLQLMLLSELNIPWLGLRLLLRATAIGVKHARGSRTKNNLQASISFALVAVAHGATHHVHVCSIREYQ